MTAGPVVTAVEGAPLATTPPAAPAPRRLHGLRGVLGPGPVPWGTVIALAVLLTLTDSFVVAVVHGAVGSIERFGGFRSWMFTSAVSLPLFVLVVLGALAVVRRWFGPALHTPKKVVVAGLLIAVFSSLLGTGMVVANTAYDYHLQARQIGQTVARHVHDHTGRTASRERADTVAAQEKAARDAGKIILLANVVVVAWVTAMRGGRLDAGGRRRAGS